MKRQAAISEMKIELHLSFRVVDAELDPQRVSDALGLLPTRSGRRGEMISARVQKPRAKGFWILDSAQDVARSESFDSHVTWLLDRLEPVAERIQGLASEHEVVDLWAGIYTGKDHGGPVVGATALRRVANLGLALCLDVYAEILDDAAD